MKEESNSGVLLISFLLPLVGLIIGLIQIAKGSKFGAQTLGASIAFWVFWTLVFMAFTGI